MKCLIFEPMESLKDKLLALLTQVPPYLKITQDLEALKQLDFTLMMYSEM